MNNRGQAVVEAVFVIPMLVFLVAGVIAAGFWLGTSITATAAAREGARVAALTADCVSIIDSVKKTMDVVDQDPRGERITLELDPDPLPSTGQDVTVRVVYEPPVLFAFFKSVYENKTPGSYPFGTVIGSATARMEIDPPNNQACVR